MSDQTALNPQGMREAGPPSPVLRTPSPKRQWGGEKRSSADRRPARRRGLGGPRLRREFLLELKASDADDFAAVAAGLQRLRHRQCHREPLSRALGDGLFELRHVGKLNTRVLWFFMNGLRIVPVHGIRNQGQAIPARDLDTARTRMRDWRERHEP